MAGNLSTVVVTVTGYTTVYPPVMVTKSQPTTLYATIMTVSTDSVDTSGSSRSTASAQSSLTHTTQDTSKTQVADSSTPTKRTSSLVSRSTSTSITTNPSTDNSAKGSSLLSSTTASDIPLPSTTPSNSGLPTGWPTPSSQLDHHTHSNNAVPILLLLWIILTTLLFLGALVYFAWRLARGHCADCTRKNEELITMKKRLAGKETVTPAMVQQREMDDQVAGMGISRGQEIRVSEADLDAGITVRLDNPEQGVRVKLDKAEGKGKERVRSDPFDLEMGAQMALGSRWSDSTVDSVASRASKVSDHSSASQFRHSRNTEQNRAQAFEELDRPRSGLPVVDLSRREVWEYLWPNERRAEDGKEGEKKLKFPLPTYNGLARASGMRSGVKNPYVFQTSGAGGADDRAGSAASHPSDFITVGLDDDITQQQPRRI